jgi:HSP20 family protein
VAAGLNRILREAACSKGSCFEESQLIIQERPMSKLNIQKVPSVEERNLPVFDELKNIAEKIRIRAFKLFSSRGSAEGNDLQDWLLAEREICWPTAELVEEDDEFTVKVALAGFDAKDIEVTANPRELIIKASHKDKRKKTDKKDGAKIRWSEFRSKDVYRHITLPADIDVNDIAAEFEQGMLEIKAPKAEQRTGNTSKENTKVKVSS